MSEVLAYTSTFFKKRLNGGRNLRSFAIELEIAMDHPRKFVDSLEQRTPRRECFAGIISELATCAHALRSKNKLIGVQPVVAAIVDQRFDNIFPRRREREIPASKREYLYFACGFHNQTVMRFLQCEECLYIAEVVVPS